MLQIHYTTTMGSNVTNSLYHNNPEFIKLRNMEGKMALQCAVENKKEVTIRALMDFHAKNEKDERQRSIENVYNGFINYAIYNEDENYLGIILSKIREKNIGIDLIDVLQCAIEYDKQNMVKYLVDNYEFDARQLLEVQAQVLKNGKIEIGDILTAKLSSEILRLMSPVK